MAMVLNEEQLMLRESAAGFLAEKASIRQLRALRDAGDELRFDPDVWQGMVEMGWAGIAIPENYGGLGYGYTGLGLVLEQMGRHLSAAPLQSSVLLGATLINLLGRESQKAEWLPLIAAGEKRVSIALQETAQFAPRRLAMQAMQVDDGWVISGEKRMVLDAIGADAFLVVVRAPGAASSADGSSVFIVGAAHPGLSVSRCDMVDSRQYGALSFDNVQLTTAHLLGDVGAAWAAVEKTLDIGAIGVAAELLGLSLETFERTMDYIRERRQFGRPIGSFQGLQHRAAILFAELELARSIVLKALQAIDRGDDLSLLASAAKAKLCEVAGMASNEGIQMHGGVGMTDEYDVGFFLKRARALQHCLGDQNYHLDRFARCSGF